MVKLLSSVSNVVVSAKSLFTTSESTRAGRAASPGEDTSAFTEQRVAVTLLYVRNTTSSSSAFMWMHSKMDCSTPLLKAVLATMPIARFNDAVSMLNLIFRFLFYCCLK